VSEPSPSIYNQHNHAAEGGIQNIAHTIYVGSDRQPFTVAGFSALSPGRAAQLLSEMTPDQAAVVLAEIEPSSAATIVERMNDELATDVVTSMHPRYANGILDQLSADTASPLRMLVEAADSISKQGAAWRAKVGTPSGKLHQAGPSRRETTGFRSDYSGGTVFWSPRTGVGMVSAALKPYFDEHGGLASLLGFPIGPEIEAAVSFSGTTGTFQRFESLWDYGGELAERLGAECGATIYRSERHGTYLTRGGIGEYYELSGGTRGPLGFPRSEEIAVGESANGSPAGYRQEFEGGAVYWSDSTGAVSINGAILQRYLASWRSVLGFPIAEKEIIEESPLGTTGVFQLFSNGAIYACEAYGARAVYGRFYRSFVAGSATIGLFGFPVSDRILLSDRKGGELRWYQPFEGGMIYLSHKFGVFTVVGEVFQLLAGNHEAVERLGVAAGPQRSLDGGPDVVQFFEHGVVSVVDSKAQSWVSPE